MEEKKHSEAVRVVLLLLLLLSYNDLMDQSVLISAVNYNIKLNWSLRSNNDPLLQPLKFQTPNWETGKSSKNSSKWLHDSCCIGI